MAYSQADLDAIAAAQAAHPSLPPGYLRGVAQIETGRSANPDTAASGTGPVGLFQIAPSTYQDPGYGLAPHPISRQDAITALQDPNVSAQFAGDYLSALAVAKGGLDPATRAYSGGGYGQADVIAASAPVTGSDTPLAGGTGATSPGGTNSAATGSTPGQAGGSSKLGSLLTPVWEVITRSLVFILGMALLLVAAFALLFNSKTVQVNVRDLTAGAGKAAA